MRRMMKGFWDIAMVAAIVFAIAGLVIGDMLMLRIAAPMVLVALCTVMSYKE